MHAETHPTSPLSLQLDRAAALCERNGARLTELRRQVLSLILAAGKPVGAYDLLEQLRGQRRGAAPPTVYRALEFLMEHGLIHKVERLSAFVGCPVHDHHAHAAQFLICSTCGAVQELEDDTVREALAKAAAKRGFAITGVTIEAEGRCAGCSRPALS
jgi:Fur family zinc uptake transcriptional regulator